VWLFPILAAFVAPGVAADLAEGVRVGEVTAASALVWVRTSAGGRAPDGAVRGAPDRVTLSCRGLQPLHAQTAEARDFTHVFTLNGLKPATEYPCEAAATTPPPFKFRFRTAPLASTPSPVRFTVVTGMMYRDLDDPRGFRIFDAMLRDRPDFLVLTGDNVYYDNEPPRATTPELARYHWQRMFSLGRHTALFAQVPAYWEKDDHDILSDDCWPGMDPEFMKPMTFAQGLEIFAQQAPVQGLPYRSFRWGRHLEVWLPEGREFRSPNRDPDGPAKSILGQKQKAWLKASVGASDATWKVIVSPTPWVGPDRSQKGDNYANRAFATEGREMRSWAAATRNLLVITGDRHWQYHSVDPDTRLEEFSCGPASDQHAGGSPGQNDAYHRFHRVKGGYASVSVSAHGRLILRLHDVAGTVVYQQPRP
jgi:alkaline phosphatase D